MVKKTNEFQEKYVLQLDNLAEDKNELLQAIKSLKGKKVILNIYPFDAELVGKIIDQGEEEKYKYCDIKPADLELVRLLLCINQNKTNYINCKYNEEIEQCLKDEYVGNLIKKKLHMITSKRIGDISSEDLASIVKHMNDSYILNIYVSYLFILDTKSTREFVKEMLGPSYIARKILELYRPKRKKVDEKYLLEIGRKLGKYDERYYKSYIKMVEGLDSDNIRVFEARLLFLADNDFKTKIRRIK